MYSRHDTLDIEVRGIVSVLPKKKIDNSYFNKYLNEKALNDVSNITGVKTRYWATETQTTKDLCLEAAKSIISGLSIKSDTIDALVFVTQTPDNILPGNSFLIHKNDSNEFYNIRMLFSIFVFYF